ncbi:4'-phosphopantetheinyl transferase [Luteibacter sp. UNCMF331Sha3.1]|uniref:4'-phosphopantetheinyl transferase family protein n=1 Tax=Luteibacter sp. UNCMF331Sha3.1 TaxID=1502760 RepID=UPI0008B0B3A7|nr:4'-phosphopantetheinyl transferase superfamily protein [Luteibacter sp. UNCMF331Sha3.1]SEM54943.1 4'-phosphopantetheinyl transferase [Luteibacter sp. UNCMF331Sha3.1]
MTQAIPELTEHEIHIWRSTWSGGAGEAAFARLIGGYAGTDAPAIARGEHGKPFLPAPFDSLGFNWSHSGDIALLAVGRGAPGFQLGIDVETVRPRPRALELSRRFFAPDETDALAAREGDERLGAFIRLWTAKEAVLKAHGGGLSYGLHRASFRLDGDGIIPFAFEGEIAPASRWQVHPLALGADVMSAVAWRGEPRRIRVFTFAL